MARGQKIKIRPYVCPDRPDLGPRLSIEQNGRILPLASVIEIVGEIVSSERAGSNSSDYVSVHITNPASELLYDT